MKRSLLLATVIASAMPAIIFGGIFTFLGPKISWSIFAMLMAFTVTFLYTVFAGIPCVFLLKRFNLFGWFPMLCTGFFLGCTFSAVLSLTINAPCAGCSHKAETEWLITNGVRTITGWHEQLISVVAFGLLGAFVSGLFYIVLHKVKP